MEETNHPPPLLYHICFNQGLVMTEYIPHRRCELPILVVHTLGLEEKGRTAVQHLPVEMVFWYHSFQWTRVADTALAPDIHIE